MVSRCSRLGEFMPGNPRREKLASLGLRLRTKRLSLVSAERLAVLMVLLRHCSRLGHRTCRRCHSRRFRLCGLASAGDIKYHAADRAHRCHCIEHRVLEVQVEEDRISQRDPRPKYDLAAWPRWRSLRIG